MVVVHQVTVVWVKIGNQVHLWGHATTSAGTGGNTTVVALAILEIQIFQQLLMMEEILMVRKGGTVAFNAQTNFLNVVGAYKRSYQATTAIREFGLYVETQSGNTLETVTKYCTVEDIEPVFNFDGHMNAPLALNN